MDHVSDTVYEINHIIHFCLLTTSTTLTSTRTSHATSVTPTPADYAPDGLLLINASHLAEHPLPEQDLDLVSGVIPQQSKIDHSLVAPPVRILPCPAYTAARYWILDTGSPQSFIHQGAFDKIVASCAADHSCVRSTSPRLWYGFGSSKILSTYHQARMTVQFRYDDEKPASLAVWMYIVPNDTVCVPMRLCRES